VRGLDRGFCWHVAFADSGWLHMPRANQAQRIKPCPVTRHSLLTTTSGDRERLHGRTPIATTPCHPPRPRGGSPLSDHCLFGLPVERTNLARVVALGWRDSSSCRWRRADGGTELTSSAGELPLNLCRNSLPNKQLRCIAGRRYLTFSSQVVGSNLTLSNISRQLRRRM
jgi:hypothetical protein